MNEKLELLKNLPRPLRVINMISGSGTTNLSVLESEQPGRYLSGLTETVALISSDPAASGLEKAIQAGFPAEHAHIVDPKNDLGGQLANLFEIYHPDFYHQMGWIPLTPEQIVEIYLGLNQHYGPGGKWMYGDRRPYAHKLFCEMIGETRPIPVFAQLVETEYDAGQAIYSELTEFYPGETLEDAIKRIIKIEHGVQIQARRSLGTGKAYPHPLPEIAYSEAEEALLFIAKKEARDRYPVKKT